MKIRMLRERTGPDNGIWFPPVGGEILVPDDVGAALCSAGWAEPVAVPMPVETRAAAPEPPQEPEPDEEPDALIPAAPEPSGTPAAAPSGAGREVTP